MRQQSLFREYIPIIGLDELVIDNFKDGGLRFPNTRFHGLGMTKTRLLRKYPFYSVDSTTWLNGKRFGKMLTNSECKFDKSTCAGVCDRQIPVYRVISSRMRDPYNAINVGGRLVRVGDEIATG